MSIGNEWKQRLEAASQATEAASEAAATTAAEQRAKSVIAQLQESLGSINECCCRVMALEESEAAHGFDVLRHEQHTSSGLFLGAAKTVVEWCLRNDLDVHVSEEDFSMSRGPFGAEIWVTPRGVPFREPHT